VCDYWDEPRTGLAYYQGTLTGSSAFLIVKKMITPIAIVWRQVMEKQANFAKSKQ